ncbi:hypothetical protein [Rhodocyclus tenuis]|uniref:Uncharacterized protein n=1 Tax=Rhodocyclus tenuis TaxID=1066 RepID=A0A840FYS1_RHOTE|nr:hypothetical protein [Rhodocyclus tenuis]MBB4247267.1 hypothetical protein [Rhodocyclus tenuis]
MTPLLALGLTLLSVGWLLGMAWATHATAYFQITGWRRLLYIVFWPALVIDLLQVP